MQEYFTVLQACPLFQGIDRADISGMLDCLGAKLEQARKGAVIWSEGDPADRLGLVLSGSVQIIKEDYYGRTNIVGIAGPGELFGESFACSGTDLLPVSVLAAEDCAYLLLNSKRITVSCCNACAFHSQMIRNLLTIVANKNLQFHQKLEITAKRTTREKLLAYLTSQAKQQGKNSFTIPYDRQALADYLGVERSAMSAEISKLRREGILKSEKCHFTLM